MQHAARSTHLQRRGQTCVAKSSGVAVFRIAALGLAPAAKRSRVTLQWPLSAAAIRAVTPSGCVIWFTGAPCRSNVATEPKCPNSAATLRTVKGRDGLRLYTQGTQRGWSRQCALTSVAPRHRAALCLGRHHCGANTQAFVESHSEPLRMPQTHHRQRARGLGQHHAPTAS